MGDVYQLRYLGVDAKYEFFLALEKDEILGYSIIQKYFENPYFSTNKGMFRGEPGLIYSLKKKKGIGSLLFLISSFEIIKDDKIEVFRCEAIKDNVFDKWCSKLGLDFVEEKDIFNCYELIFEKNKRKGLEKKIKDCIKSL